MLYTGNGDKGATTLYGTSKKTSKSSIEIEALGTIDEVNSFLGICKVVSEKSGYKIGDESFQKIIHGVQETLFSIQAELAGFSMRIPKEKVTELERLIVEAEKILPPITTFFISGGTEFAALLDTARTIVRRGERRVVEVSELHPGLVGEETLRYLNRLSSLFYALARLANHYAGIPEKAPSYE